MARQAELPPDRAFLHVIYDHRYLAVAGYAWTQFGPGGMQERQEAINQFVSGVGALIQDSLLLHARALIEFYLPDHPRATDIVRNDFGLPEPSQTVQSQLGGYRRPIEVHLGHLTAWRDEAYRAANALTPSGKQRQRPDWNLDNLAIVDGIVRALDEAAGSGVRWSQRFASCIRLRWQF